jgi:hypothetical protein
MTALKPACPPEVAVSVFGGTAVRSYLKIEREVWLR